jgi:hypothetical protein
MNKKIAASLIVVMSVGVLPRDCIAENAPHSDVKWAKTIDEEESIERLKQTTANRVFAEDIRNHSIHFLAIGGYASSVPGVPDYVDKFGTSVPYKLIADTGDDVIDDVDGKRREFAEKFAAQYNRLVLAYLTHLPSQMGSGRQK